VVPDRDGTYLAGLALANKGGEGHEPANQTGDHRTWGRGADAAGVPDAMAHRAAEPPSAELSSETRRNVGVATDDRQNYRHFLPLLVAKTGKSAAFKPAPRLRAGRRSCCRLPPALARCREASAGGSTPRQPQSARAGPCRRSARGKTLFLSPAVTHCEKSTATVRHTTPRFVELSTG
jgi:hypothetical protein